MALVSMASSTQASSILLRFRTLIIVGIVLITACATQQEVKDERPWPSSETDSDPVIAEWMDALSTIPSTYREVRPITRYVELLPKAESGDADAQYELAQIYNFCGRIPDEAQTRQLIARGMPASAAAYFPRSRAHCAGFESALVGWDDPTQPIDHWTLHAIANDQPMALAEKSLKDYRDWQRQKAQFEQAGETLQPLRNPPSDEQIYLALARGTERPEILGYAISLGYRYFRVFNADAYMASQGYDPAAGNMKRGPLREAWSILGCHSLPVCSLESLLSDMRSKYDRIEMDENVQAALELYEAIETHDWGKLGLAENPVH